MPEPLIVGIDLGTSTSEVAALRNGKPTLVREVAGAAHGFLPSVVGLAPDGRVCVGTIAEALLIPRPNAAIAEVKRLMGTESRVQLAGEEYSPQEVSAILLRHLKQEAEKALGGAIIEAVITVPAYFTNAQRQATREAGELAGLTVRRLVNEPTAAALAYGLERPGVEEKIVVYDLGGGTLDVTVLELSEGVLDVIASTGDTRLGGKDFDERLMHFLAGQCQTATGVDLFATPRLHQRLKAAAKRAKEELSGADRTTVVLDNLGLAADGEPIDFTYTLTRAAFEAQIEDLVNSTARQLDEALDEKGIKPGDIGTVLLIGGSTRVPLVRQFVSGYFGGRALRTELDPDEAVALGAAVLAGIESHAIDPGQLVITDVSPHTLGVSIVKADEDGDEQAGYFDALIHKQSTIPRTAAKRYATVTDGQPTVRVQVFQGDAPLCADNEPVGEFVLEGLPPAPAGSPLDIEFTYNLSGELEVVARAPQWGLEKRVRMRPSRRHLSASEKEAARARLERLWTDGAPKRTAGTSAAPAAARSRSETPPKWRTSRHYSRVAALMTHAERRLPTLTPEVAERVAARIRALRAALERDDELGLEREERALTDVLFALE